MLPTPPHSHPQNQKLFSDFLAANTKGAIDLQDGYAQVVADAWDNFYESNCGSDDPTCDLAHEQLGRWAQAVPAPAGRWCKSGSHVLPACVRSATRSRLVAANQLPAC